ncbi:MAG: PAS domain-containing sensor histidine kinase [Solirubrobacteraceae bacterium]
MGADASVEAILDSIAQPVWVVDHDGVVVFVNPAAIAALGYDDLEELRGRPGHDTIHYKRPDGSPYPAEECPMTRMRGTGETLVVEDDWFVRRDGSMFPVSYTSAPIEMPAGPGVVVAFKDMEEQRRAEQALREREAILAQVGQPVWVTDAAGRFHYLNAAAARTLGYEDPAELVGRPAHDTVHYKYPDGTPFLEADCGLAKARKAGETLHEVEDWLVRRDGEIIHVSYSSAPFRLPDGLGSVTAFSDVEQRRRAEQAARERDVAQARAFELRAARRRVIEAADAARARLERDLHDGAQQQFVSAVLNLQLAERVADPAAARDLRALAIDLANSGIAELRRLASGLHPAILSERGLGPAVEALASRLPLLVDVLDTPAERLPAPVEASVYFFVSEALTNTVKHAQAGLATVRIAAENGGLVVEVGDDGVGGAGSAGGSGLRGLGDRVGALDGALELHSPPGQGTLLRARIPLPR